MRRPLIAKPEALEVAPSIADIERFLRKCNQEGDCWIWHGYIDENGYGRFHYLGTNVGAHRFATALFIGAIPKGRGVHHTCESHACVNPAHLRIMTPVANSKLARKAQLTNPKLPF